VAGYSGTPLSRKLGIKPGSRLFVAGAPSNYAKLLAPLPDGVEIVSRMPASIAFAHLFTTKRADLATKLRAALAKLHPDGTIWVSWPKKASRVATDITEDTIREVALPLGLVDVKVCAVDEIWSGLKLVIRKENR
jgi:Protein of unknown function (DUF3052)